LVLTTLLLVCCTAIPSETPRTTTFATTVETNATTTADPKAELEVSKPDAPTPKTTASSTAKTDLEIGSAGEAAIEPVLNSPVKPAFAESYETAGERRAWYGLLILGHGAAAFDAWTTRRVIGGGYGVEADPFERPFAHSGAIYATTQITPLVMDFVGYRMMRSRHPLIRKAWCIPQLGSGGVSLAAGVHNYRIAP
jgi:hypothetical protein